METQERIAKLEATIKATNQVEKRLVLLTRGLDDRIERLDGLLKRAEKMRNMFNRIEYPEDEDTDYMG